MYSVSEAYIEQMMKRATRRRLTGTIGSVAFSGVDVVRDSFSITGRATEESDTKIGGVYLGEMELTFVPSFISKVARNEYKDKEVSINIGLYVEEEGEDPVWVDVPCGTFTLQAPKISKQGITVSGFDHMKKLDKNFSIDQTTGTPYAYLSYMATQCGVTLGNTQEEIEAMPNGTELLGLYTDGNDIETYRDMLYWLAQACCCFACADREGNIVLRRFGVSNTVEFDEEHRDADVVFSGYTTKWTGISVVDMATQMTMYYGLAVDDGLTMNLGANPFLQLGTLEAVTRRRKNVLNGVAQIQYTPFYVNSARDPIFDLGDEIGFTGGISGNSTGCIMAYTFEFDNYTFEGYGDDPALANARSKTDKNIAGLMQQTVENEVTYYNFANVEALTFGEEQETEIASLSFTSAQMTTVKIMHEFVLDMIADLASDCSYELRYYLDNELLSYYPSERIGGIQGVSTGTTEFTITRDFFYILKNVEPSIRHTWRVTMITHDIDSTTIDVDHAHVTLEGQRLYGDEYFDGYIEAQDNITVIPYGYLGVISISDEAEVNIDISATPIQISENITLYDMAEMQLSPITDTMAIYMERIILKRMTEDGKQRITEDGHRRISD